MEALNTMVASTYIIMGASTLGKAKDARSAELSGHRRIAGISTGVAQITMITSIVRLRRRMHLSIVRLRRRMHL